MMHPDRDGRLQLLPDLDRDIIEFSWDLEFDEDERPWIVVRCDGEVILREETWYENADHFRDVVRTLIEKYPGRVYDIVPTDYADNFLFGDDMRALSGVPKTRALCKKDLQKHRQRSGRIGNADI